MSTFQAFHNYYHKLFERISIIQHSLDLDTVVLINHINVTMLTMIGLIILTLRLKVKQKPKRTKLPFTNLKYSYYSFIQFYLKLVYINERWLVDHPNDGINFNKYINDLLTKKGFG